MYRTHRCIDEYRNLQVYAVCHRVLPSIREANLRARLTLKYVASAGTIAEEVISTIRTAQAFGTQHVLADLYDTYIFDAHAVDMKAAVWHGGGLACFFFVIYSAYALTFSFGITLMNAGHGKDTSMSSHSI